MSASGDWKPLDRLNNDEFLKLMPHLSLEHVFLTQVFVPKKKWIPFVDANFKTLQVKCGGCGGKPVRFQDIKKHLKQSDHQMTIRSNVKQFYHPFYTYGKKDIKLSRGEHVANDVRGNAILELSRQQERFKKDCLLAKKFVEVVNQREREAQDDQLLQLTLNATIEKPEQMFVKVCLPFIDIPKVLFCIIGGEWQPVFSSKTLTKKANFRCNICAVNCSGIGSVNSHSNGFTHKLRQLEVLGLRYENSSKVNKNCCIQFEDSFSFSVKDEAREFFKDQLGNDCAESGSAALESIQLSSDIAEKVNALDQNVPRALTSNAILNPRREQRDHECGKILEAHQVVGQLGVEYILKIMKHEKDRDPKFECGLCEYMGDGNRMQRHLLNYDHKKKYLDLHYSDTIKKYESALGHMRYMEFRAVMSEIVEKVAIEVEKVHSRSLPYTVSSNDYKVRRPDLIAEVYALLHASQNRGPSFANVLSQEEVRNLKNCAAELTDNRAHKSIENVVFTTPPPNQKTYLHQFSHDPVMRLKTYLQMQCKQRTSRSLSPARATQLREVQSKDGSNSERSHTRNRDHRTRSRSPRFNVRTRSPRREHTSDNESVNVQHHQNIWDVYRREIAIAANEIEVAYENYRKNPESHPLYEDEWNSFWQRRKKDLEREGVNHRAYNFQPEWVHYFKQRIEQLFGEDLHKSQINIRHKLGIPLNAEEDCQQDLHVAAGQFAEERRMKERPRRTEELDEFRGNKRGISPNEYRGPSSNKRQFPGERFPARTERIKVQQSNMLELVTNISDNHSNVVHVLRLMAALEEHLGSLGGKVIDLMSKALQMEKNFRGNSVEFEAQILTAANCHLLETAMEKLKGILFAELLDDKKTSGFNRVIQFTTNLLKYAEKMGWRRDILPVRDAFHGRDNRPRGDIQKHMNFSQISGGGSDMQTSNEKSLSDTLMDLVSSSQRNEKQSMKMPEQLIGSVDLQQRHHNHSSMPLVCPPPPTIKGSNLNTNIFAAYNSQRNSGLAAFNTKLSLDQSNSQQTRQHQSEIGHLHRSSNIGGNNMNNNSFKNNNDSRTNINSRPNTGPTTSGLNVGGGINHNNNNPNGRPGQQFKNTQFIPNMGNTNNAMYHGGGGGMGGGNRNQNWSHWNNTN